MAVAAFVAARPALQALLLGMASALALPPLHAVPLLLATIPALLALLGRAGGWKRAAWLGACFGYGFHLVGVYWVTHSLFTDLGRWFWLVPLAAPGLALPLALTSVLPGLAAWWLPPGWARVLGFAAAWTAAEMLRGVLFSGFPWNLLGTVWAFHELPMQLASVIGTHGLSLLTVLAAALPALASRRALLAGAAVLALALGWGGWRLAQPSSAGPGVRLVVVQGNVAQDLKWDPAQRAAIFERYLTLTELAARDAAAAHPEAPIAVLWPETASPFLLAQDPQAIAAAARTLPPRATLLAGTVRAEWDTRGQLSALFNSLVALSPAGEIVGLYDKAHLVPFGEYMPLGGLLPIRLVTGGVDFSAGPGPVSLTVPGLPALSPLICYEVIFPGRVTAGSRPGWLVNITNDAWFGRSAGPYQHFAAARLRAIEEGLPMVRAAQTGISAIVDARGRVVARLGLGATGTLGEWLPAAEAPTAFARGGLAWPGSMLMLVFMLALWQARRRQPDRESRQT